MWRLFVLFCTLVFAVLLAPASAQTRQDIVLAPVWSGLVSPVDITHAADGSGRLFIVEQRGRIRVVRGGQLLATPYLDISARVKTGGEQGLLGLAFHPRFASNGRFFVFYTRARANDGNGNELVISSLTATPTADVAVANSEQVLLVIAHPNFGNHNGGSLKFGRDGFLYVGTGDGGSGNDPGNNAQNRASLLGKILRLNVDAPGLLYGIPNDNPYIPGNLEGFRAEIYAYGVRNPWRISVDRANGDIFIADVGQGAREEVNLLAPGRGGLNFGWRGREGTLCTAGVPANECNLRTPTDPIIEYGRDQGASITGGFRYRGSLQRPLAGRYIYADYVSGRVFSAAPDSMGKWLSREGAMFAGIASFGEDEAGELYAAGHGAGQILRVLAGALDADNDGIPNDLEAASGTDPLRKDNDIFAATDGGARLFVQQQYRDFLGREADAQGLAFWVPSITGGTSTRGALPAAFLNAPEFDASAGAVTRLYLAAFARLPDLGGWQFFSRELANAGQTLVALSTQFAQSEEFRARYGSLSDAQYVGQLYRNVLGREADADGLSFWIGQVAQIGRGGMLAAFSQSSEFAANTRAEVFVFSAYAAMLQRVPDNEGLAFWAGEYRRGRADALPGLFVASAEYRQRFVD
jgi:Glucose / Sorbosone dehydrogenase/Domain of unknown function (DUF4214)